MTNGEKKDERPGAEEKYKALVETAADAIFTLDLLGRFTFVNPAAERISGYSEEELVGKHFRELLPAKYIPACLNAFQKALRGQPTPPIEIEMITKEGERVPLELLGRPVKRGRKVVEIIAIARDITERKRAEEALRIRDSAIASSINAIALADLEGNLTYANSSFLKLWEYDDEKEVLGKPAVEFWQMEEKALEVVEALRDRGSWIRELVAKRKDGSLLDVQLSASMVTDEVGKPICMMASFIDITERKRAEEALREAEENFRAVAENANDGILVAVGEGVHVYVNKRAAEITGYSVAELFETGIKDLVHPDEFEKIMERYRKRLAGKPVPTRYETIFIRKDGKSVPVEFTAAKTVWQGEPASVVFFRDITERKRTEEALRKSEERYKKQFEEAMDAIFIAEAETGILVDCNRVALKLVGREKSELVGKHQRILHPPEEIEGELSRTFKQHLKEKEGQILETQVITKKGEIKDVAIKASIFELEGQKVLLGIFRDITERKQAEEALRDEKALMDALMDNIPDSIYFKDRQCRLTRINRKMMRDLNLEEMSQALGKTDVDLFGEEFGRKTLTQDQRIMTTGEPIIGLIESRQLGDGQINWTSTSKVPLRDASGQIVGLVGATREINEVKQAEEETRKRLAETTALHKVAEIINATLDLKEVFQRVVEELSNTFGYRLVDIYLLEEDELRLRANVGYDDKTTIELIPLERGVVGRVARTGQPAFIRDVHQEPDYISAYPDIENEICVPIMRGDTLLGTLNVESDGKRPLTEDDLQLLVTLSSHIGVAIENARLYEEEQQQRQEAETLRQVAQALSATLDLQQVFKSILSELQRVVPYDSASVQLLKGDHLEIIGGHGFPNLDELLGISFPLDGNNPNRQVMASRAPFIVEDAPAVYSGFRQEPHAPAGIRAWLGVPLLFGDRLIGMIALDKRVPGFYTEEHARLALAFAAQAAIAIENARLYEEEQRLSTQRKTVAEVGRTIAAILDLDTLLSRVVHLIAQGFGYYRVHIFQIDPDSEYAVYKAGIGKAGLAIVEEGLRLKIGEEGLVGWVAQHGEPVLVPDVSQDPRYYSHPDLPDTHSELDVPIRAGEKVIGVLDVQSRELDAFDESDLATLETLAHQLAVAMENARLYEETQQLAITDGLTGLYNLRYFYEALEKEIQRSERCHRSVSLIILDIDNFKAYNDLYGHLAGDDLLKELAQLMSKVTRRTDTLARYGGEEFVVILPETETEGARLLAERLQVKVREHRFSIQDGQAIGQITISLGVATYPHHADSAKTLVGAADRALLRAKRAGKNRLSVYGEELIELKPR